MMSSPLPSALESGESLPADTSADSPTPTTETTPDPNSGGASFADLGLHPELVKSLTEGGYAAPTPIQEQAIPPLLELRDVVGQAQTGTGKTAAFSLPMIQNLDVDQRVVQGLVLCPTRELAMQVSASLSSYGDSRRVRVLTVYGGAPIHKQVAKLRHGVHVVVGTPGRVKDCITRGELSLDHVRHVVLDEADEMLRMGFIDDVEEILGQVPAQRQTALFSATMPPTIERVAASHLRNPVQVSIERRTRTVEGIDQKVLIVHGSEKTNVLTRLVEAESTDAVLVFVRTRASCAELVKTLAARGVPGAALHGELSQDQREAIVSQLRSREIQLVVATDIAARGLDVEGISHVINYDPPSEPEIYVHRIGRTGRAGRTGVSILFLTPKQQRVQRAIEQYTSQRMTTIQVPSNAQLLAGRTERFRTAVFETAEAGDLDAYDRVIGEMLEQPGADLRRIAAALAKMATKERPLEIDDPEPSAGRGAPPKRGLGADSVRLFLPLGRHAGIRPGDLVGAITNEAQIPGRSLGSIDIREKVSFVEVAKDVSQRVLDRMQNFTIRGRTASLVTARPGSFERRPERPSGGRRFERPRPKRKYDGPKPWDTKFERKRKPVRD